MSSGGRESPPDPSGARERSGRRKKIKHTLKGFGSPSTGTRLSDGATNPTETETRPSTPELANSDATSIAPLSPHPLTRSACRNLSVIFESSESTKSLSDEGIPPNKSASTSVVSKQDNHIEHLNERSRYSLPNIPSLVSKSSKSVESTKTSVAEKIAYFEESLRNGRVASTPSPRLKSFLPVPQESRRRYLPSSLNATPSPSPPSGVSFPTRPSYSEESKFETKLYAGFLWYLNVHGSGPPKWILCNASLYRTALLLTWQTSGTIRATVTLDLLSCLNVRSTPTASDPSVASDIGAIVWNWDRDRMPQSVEDIYPMHLQFDDGVERIATSTLIDRVTWIGMLLEFLPFNLSRDRVTTPRKHAFSSLPDSGSVATIVPLQESQDAATATVTPPSPTSLRPTNGHNRTRSAGDAPKVPQISKEMQRKSLIRRISSMSILSIDSSNPSEFGYGYVTTNESSTLSTVPSRRFSVSLKSVTSLLSRQGSRMDDISSDGSEPAAPVSSAPARTRTLLHSRSGSQESALVVSDEAEGNTLGRLFRKRDGSAPARLRKPKPHLPALARLTIDPYRAFSDGQIPTRLEETTSTLSMMEDLGDYPRSPTYHSAVTSMLSTSQYHTAYEGDPKEIESPRWSSVQGRIQTSSASDTLFVTASSFTSSDAWMAHLTAASLTSLKVPSSRRQPHSGSSTPGTMSSSHTFSHLFDVLSAPLPALTADNTSSIVSIVANVGSTRLTTVSTAEDGVSSADATLGGPLTQVDMPETIPVVELSREMETQSYDYPPVPPPSVDNLPPTSLRLFGEAISTPRANSTLGVAATTSAQASPPNTLHQMLPNEIFTQPDVTNSIQEVLPPTRFGLLRNGCTEYEITRVQSTTPSAPSVLREPRPLLPSEEPFRRRVVPKRVVSRQKSDSSLHSSVFLPSILSVIPNTPPPVEVSLTPVQASVYPSVIDTITSNPDLGPQVNGLGQDNHTCEERLNNILEFVERTRTAQTVTSAEFSEQLGRIEIQLLELGRLIRERMATTQIEPSDDNLIAINTHKRPKCTDALPHRHPRVLHKPTIISLSPPRSTFHDETTLTSVELQASITHSDISCGVGTSLRHCVEPLTPSPAGDTSNSLHLSQFPEVPHAPRRPLSVGYAARTVSDIELRDMIERLSGSIDALVARQQVFNDALEGLQHTGIAFESRTLPNEAENENIGPRLIELLKSLQEFAQRQRDSYPDRSHDNPHHFPDLSSTRTSLPDAGDVEILPVLPIATGAISLAYAHKQPAPQKRPQSFLPSAHSCGDTSPSRDSSPRSRARSADNVVIMANEPNEAAGMNSVELSDNDTLGSLGGAPFTPRHHAPIARTWDRKSKPDRTRVHWATLFETATDNLPHTGAEGGSGTDSAATQVTRLLQESRTRQEAASAQQDETVRYLGELNDWLSRDATDRRAELQGLGDRLDGIQRAMMHGPALAVSIAVPLRPSPCLTALSEASSGHDTWPTAQEDEDPIVPPPPPKPGKTPAVIPVKSRKQRPKGHEGIATHSTSSLDLPSNGEEGHTINQEIPSGVVPPPTSHHSGGQKVTFATPGEELPAATLPQGAPTAASSLIRVSGNTLVSQPETGLFGVSGDIDDDAADQQPSNNDRRRSRPRARKPLARETPEIVVNTPGARGQRDSSTRLKSPDRSPDPATAYLPRNVAPGRGRHRHPVVTVLPSDYRADSHKVAPSVTQHHIIISGGGAHAVPRTARAITRPDFVEGRGGSSDREYTCGPTSLPRNHRRRSRNTRYGEHDTARRSPRSLDYVIMHRDHYHEPSAFRRSSSNSEPPTRHENRRYMPRRSRSNTPRYRTVSPNHRLSSLRNASPLILSPFPLHCGRPLPPILTEPTVVDLYQPQSHGPENLCHAAEGHSDGSRVLHSPPFLHRPIQAQVYEHHENRPDLWAHTASQQYISSIISPERLQRKSLVTTRDRTSEPAHEVTGPSPIGPIVHPLSVHRINEAISHQQSQLAVSAVIQPQVMKPQGARVNGSSQQQTATLRSGDFISQPSAVPNGVQVSGMESLRNVGVPEPRLVSSQTTGARDMAGSAPTQLYHGGCKRGENARKQAESRLSAISEKLEPRLPSLLSFEIIAESGQETVRSDPDFSEQARDTIFLVRQEERQRILDESARMQRLVHEQFILELQDPSLKKAHCNDPEAGTSVFSRRTHAHESTRTPLPSAANTIAIASTCSPSEKGVQKFLGDTQAAGTSAPNSDLHRSVGTIANGDQNVGRSQPTSRPLSAISRVAESRRSDQGPRIDQLLQSLKDGRPPPVPTDPYSLELARERVKARCLEEEIQKTKDAIQAIKDERAAANERRRLETLTSICQMQYEMKGQLQSTTEQLRLNQSNAGRTTEEVPATTFEDDITGVINRIYNGQSAKRGLNAQDCTVGETQSALAQDMEQLRQRNKAQKVLIEDMLGKTTKENQRNQELLLKAFKRASTEQIKANVDEQLQEFTAVMTHEVRILLREVGNLREQRRGLRHQIIEYNILRDKIKPGGEFDVSWDPAHSLTCTHFPSSGAGGAPHHEAPGFVGSTPPAPNAPVASSSGRTTAGIHNTSPLVATVTSPPPAYAQPRLNNRGAQPRAPRATNLPVVGTSQGNRQSTASRPPPPPPPPRAPRKSRPKRPE